MKRLKIGIDIGGVITRFPDEMRTLISVLISARQDVYIVTDMNYADAVEALTINDFMSLGIDPGQVISCDWGKYGDMCKAKRIEELGLDMMIDDRLDYIFAGAPVSFMLVPRPDTPYYHPTWKATKSTTKVVPIEEWDTYQKWKKAEMIAADAATGMSACLGDLDAALARTKTGVDAGAA